MRVVGGALSGRRLAALGKGAPDAQLRPTSDRVREALFNHLAHGPYPSIEGARALDLFAGSGALGIEALSRGAARAVFVDDHPTARALVRENLETLALVGRAKLFRRDATRLGPNRDAPFGFVFLDPPYGRDLAPRALASAIAGGWIAEGAVVAAELGPEDPAPATPGLEPVATRGHGDTRIALFIYRARGDAPGPLG